MTTLREDRFSLVELLVVIAVISLLSALLLPALGRARAMAKQIACANNFKQIGVKFMMYVDDNNGWGPDNSCYAFASHLEGYSAEDFNAKGGGQMDQPSIKGIYLCPAAPQVVGCSKYRSAYGFVRGGSAEPSTGGYFYWVGGTVVNLFKPYKSLLPNSVMMTEFKQHEIWGSGVASVDNANAADPSDTNDYLNQEYQGAHFFYHSRQANFLFPDGHVASYMAGAQFNNSWQAK